MKRKKQCWTAVLLMLLFLLPARAAEKDGEVWVYLKSLGEADSLEITLEGQYSVDGAGDMCFLSGSRLTVSVTEGEIYVCCGGMIWKAGDSLTLARHGKSGGLYIEGSPRGGLYAGTLTLDLREGHLFPVLKLYVEDYLLGVLPYEMSDFFPQEALRAQAVAARTYVLSRRGMREKQGYDVADTAADQVYMGYLPENANAAEAVNATMGMTGLYKGDYATCFFTASNGGETALPEDIWTGGGDYGYLTRRGDPFDLENEKSAARTLTVKADGTGLSEEVIGRLLSGASEALAAAGYSDEIQDMRIARIVGMQCANADPEDSLLYRDMRITYTLEARPLIAPTGEATAVPAPAAKLTENETSAKQENEEPAENIYKMGDWETVEGEFTLDVPLFPCFKEGMGLSLNSTDCELFSVAEEEDGFTVSARRYGHGVGMSQRGAQQMAGVYGMRCEEILSFYYPGMDIVKEVLPRVTLPPLPQWMGSADTTALSAGERYGVVRVDGASDALNVRSEPSTDGDIIDRVADGERIIVDPEGSDDNWYAVRTDKGEGYAARQYIQLE